MTALNKYLIAPSIFASSPAMSCVVLEQQNLGDLSVWLGAATTLVAAFFGAWAAFKLNSREKQREIDQKNYEAASHALFTLLWISNSLKLIQSDYLDKYRNDQFRFLQIPSLPPYSMDNAKFSARDLAFMVLPKHKDLVFKLLIEEARYREVVNTLNLRSELRTEVESELSKHGYEHGESYDINDMKKAMGDYAFNQLRALTDALYFHVDRSAESTIALKNEARKAFEELFPGKELIDFEIES